MSGVRLLFTFFYACCLAVVASGQASAQEQAVLERDAALGAPAVAVAELERGTSAEVIARKVASVNLRKASGIRWMFSFNMRFYAAGAARKTRLSERQSLPWRFCVIATALVNAVGGRPASSGSSALLRGGR